MFAGWNRFSTSDEAEGTRAAITIEMRASDPLYEIGLMLGGHRAEERFWAQMLWNLAARFDQRPKVRLQRQRLDKRRKWSHTRNIWRNALVRTMVRRAGRIFRVRRA